MRMMMMNPKNSKSVEYEGKKKHKKKNQRIERLYGASEISKIF